MDWKTYYSRLYDWEESTQLRHLSALTDFGPSAEVCELATAFFEVKSADRLIRKALAASVRFTAEKVLGLKGVVSESLLLRLIRSIPHLTAGELDPFSCCMSQEAFRELAERHRFRVDKYGSLITPEMEEEERQLREDHINETAGRGFLPLPGCALQN